MPPLFTHSGGTIIDARQKPVTYFADHIAAETELTRIMGGLSDAGDAGEVEEVSFLARAMLDLKAALAAERDWRQAGSGYRRVA